MPNFRRYYIPEAIVFITQVTRDRIKYFEPSANLDLFWETLGNVQAIHPFNLLAYVILPDHFHWLMKVGDMTGNFSKVMKSIKWNFTLNFKNHYNISASTSLWQARFWDHIIRDEDDFKNHLDYIHWNPVKHGYVKRPEDWAQSSYRYWLEREYYEIGWGWADEPTNISDMEFE